MDGGATLTRRVIDVLPPPGAPASVADVAARAGVDAKTVARTLGRLLGRRMVDRPARGVYRLTGLGETARDAGRVSPCGPRGPHTGKRRPARTGLRQKLWAALRVSRGPVTIPDLLGLAATGAERAALNNAQRYLGALARAGYVRRLPVRAPGTAPTSPGHRRWWMDPARSTGPAAPVIRVRQGELWDPNTGETFPLREAADG